LLLVIIISIASVCPWYHILYVITCLISVNMLIKTSLSTLICKGTMYRNITLLCLFFDVTSKKWYGCTGRWYATNYQIIKQFSIVFYLYVNKYLFGIELYIQHLICVFHKSMLWLIDVIGIINVPILLSTYLWSIWNCSQYNYSLKNNFMHLCQIFVRLWYHQQEGNRENITKIDEENQQIAWKY
jgi:hypothetical protein